LKPINAVTRPRLPLGHNERRLVIGALILLLILAFAPWITFSVGQGQITAIDPNERVQTITASVNGFIGEWHVKEGQLVKKGELIVDLIDNDPNYLDRLRQQKEAADAGLASADLMMRTAEIDFRRQEELFKQGLSSRKDYELAKIKVEKMNLDRSKNTATLTKAQAELARQSSQRILAPRDGIVTRILPGENGQLIKSGTPIVVFTPRVTSPAVEVWIDGNDSAYLKAGMSARVQFEGWPTMQIPGWPSLAINTFAGEVYLVDQASSMDGKFRVLIKPAATWPSERLLRLGMQAKSYIKIRDSFVLREVWRIMNGFPPLQQPINDELNRILSPQSTFKDASGQGKK
jgi:RND family efflux transporter MFP subunit